MSTKTDVKSYKGGECSTKATKIPFDVQTCWRHKGFALPGQDSLAKKTTFRRPLVVREGRLSGSKLIAFAVGGVCL